MFGRQIVGRAHDFAGPGVGIFVVAAQEAGEAQIRDLGESLGRDQQVARLYVAMDQSAHMGMHQPVRRLGDNRGRVVYRELASRTHQPPQIGAGHILAHEEIDIAIVTGVERAHQVFMIELGLGANLASEAVDCRGRGFVTRQYLDRHDTPHDRVDTLEHLAHATFANRLDDLIGAERKLRAPILELFDLPLVEHPAGNELRGDLIVGSLVHGPDAAIGGAHRMIGRFPLLGRDQPAGQRQTLKPGFLLLRNGHELTLPREAK